MTIRDAFALLGALCVGLSLVDFVYAAITQIVPECANSFTMLGAWIG